MPFSTNLGLRGPPAVRREEIMDRTMGVAHGFGFWSRRSWLGLSVCFVMAASVPDFLVRNPWL
jgi:hypothetical protein